MDASAHRSYGLEKNAWKKVNEMVNVSSSSGSNRDGFLSREEIESLSELKVTHPYQEGNLHKEYPYHDYDGVRVDVSGIGLFPNLKPDKPKTDLSFSIILHYLLIHA